MEGNNSKSLDNPYSEVQAGGGGENPEIKQEPQEYSLSQVKQDLITTDKDPRGIVKSLSPDDQLQLCHGLIGIGVVNYFRPIASRHRDIVSEKAPIMIATALREQSERKTEPQEICEKLGDKLPKPIITSEEEMKYKSMDIIVRVDALKEVALMHGLVARDEWSRSMGRNNQGRVRYASSVNYRLKIPRFRQATFFKLS